MDKLIDYGGYAAYRKTVTELTANLKTLLELSEGVQLPNTGGAGTTLFTALGGLMTATAGAILTLRRRRAITD